MGSIGTRDSGKIPDVSGVRTIVIETRSKRSVAAAALMFFCSILLYFCFSSYFVDARITTKGRVSEEDKMSTDAVSAKLNNDVESLSKTTERLNKSAKRWQCWYFTALGLGVVLTIVGVFLQFGQSTKADAAINSYKNLMELKKQQSDLAIGIAKAEASVANQKAGEANSRAGVLEKEAAKLRAETALLKQQNLDTEVALTEAKGQLETEHVKRLEMEQALAPREIWFMEVPDKSGRTRQNIEPLRAFSGIEAIIDSLPDAESMRAAANIRQAIEGAGWKVISFENRVDINGSFFDGVTLEAWSFETNKEDEAGRRRMAAGERLETFSKYGAKNTWKRSQDRRRF